MESTRRYEDVTYWRDLCDMPTALGRIAMSHFKTPGEKRALSYALDHVVAGGESRDKFERPWARKKRPA
jgi:hypothetical protein